MSSADDDGADGRRAGGARVVLVDGPLRPAGLAAAAALIAAQQQRPLRAEGELHTTYFCSTSASTINMTSYNLRSRLMPKAYSSAMTTVTYKHVN